MSVNNFIISDPGAFADIVASVNMSNLSPLNATLTFDVAYAFYAPNYADTLQVLISTDCGNTYSIVYNKGGEILSTSAPNQNQFVPSATEWRKDSVDLSAYIGNANVYVKFRNINQYGQALYIDNINLNGLTVNSNEVNLIAPFLYPNPITSNGSVTIKGNDNSEIEFHLYHLDGKNAGKILSKFNTPISFGNLHLRQGSYIYKILSKDKILNGKLIVADRK
jgi:hypothetical protein